MRTYYRGADALVTDDLFIWRTSPPQTFVVRELHDVGLSRGSSGPVRAASAYASVVALTLVGLSVLMLDAPSAYVAAPLGLLVPLAVAAAYRRARPCRWELHAVYRSVDVMLYASMDSRVFNQVSRALQRSLEDAAPPSDWYDLAAG